MEKNKRKENHTHTRVCELQYTHFFSSSKVSVAYLMPSFGHRDQQKHNNGEKEKRGRVSAFVISTLRERRKEQEINQAHGMYKKNLLDFLILDSVSYHIVHMIWWKREK